MSEKKYLTVVFDADKLTLEQRDALERHEALLASEATHALHARDRLCSELQSTRESLYVATARC